MLLTHALSLCTLTTLVAAAPLEKRWSSWSNNGRPWWTTSSASSYIAFGKRFPSGNTAPPMCDLSQATLPTAPTPLPAPAPGLTLSHVAIGRGTQNYTCDLSNLTSIPVAVGAIATLFNISCLAASNPSLLPLLPPIALDLPIPASTTPSSPMTQDLSGHHYFTDATTAFFNLDTTLHQYGTGAFKKSNASAAPASAPAGQFGAGNGAVAWLKLDAKGEDGQVFQQVYRTNTAGGSPPASCVGMPAAFEVQYSAAYWLFA